MMLQQLAQLADLIEDAVGDTVDIVAVTAGRPAAPSGEGCSAVYVFGLDAEDLNQTDQDTCVVRSRWAMGYEIWVCYPEDWDDQYGTDGEAQAAEWLYGLMEEVWCALVDAKDSGLPWPCNFVELGPLIVQARSGQAVSALGGVTLPHFCQAPTSP